jgi:magnesium chelatase subunit D
MSYPFAAVEGHAAAKHALFLLAVEPELRGALIASESGSAKTTLARAFASIYPIKNSVSTETSDHRDQVDSVAIELPIAVTEDRLLGGLDLERTLATGKRQVSRGLLARAHGRLLYVDNVNLLDPTTATHLAHALDYRRVRVERESVSAIHAADFVLVATFDPEEGEPGSLLRDRVGLILESADDVTIEERSQIIERDFRFENDPSGFGEDFEFETERCRQLIDAARKRLRRVRVSRERRRQVAHIAIRLAVEGNRADVFALKAARANAALSGRNKVEDEDIVAAVELVLAPRARVSPKAEPTGAKKPEASVDQSDQPDNKRNVDSSLAEMEEVFIPAIDSTPPQDLLAAAQRKLRSPRAGKRFKGMAAARGRYVRSDARRIRESRIAIDATLRAAAPYQSRRKLSEQPSSGSEPDSDWRDSRRVRIEPSDLRYKKLKHRSGIMFIFAVDASGSMAVNRLAQAKGALIRLLGEAYLHRDKVALISFRGEGAKLLLAPTRSVELAKQLVDTMPAGGGTPISAGVLKAVELARLSRLHGLQESVLILFTDGRANVRLDQERGIDDELRRIGALLREEDLASVIVDTKAKFLSSGEGSELAQLLGSRYLYLPRADSRALLSTIASMRNRPEKSNG